MDGRRHPRRDLGLLWFGQLVSSTGDALFLMAVAWIAGRVGGGPMAVGLVVFLGAVPFLLFGPFAGAWVDRADRRGVMIASDLARAGVLLLLPWAAGLLGGVTWGLVAVAAFLVASFSVPFNPARDALLPELARGGSLARANATIQTSWQIAQILGLGLGGLFLARAEGGEVGRVLDVLRYDGATFLVSAAALALIARRRRPAGAPPHAPFLRDVRAGLAYAARDEIVGPLLVLTALNNLALMGPAMVGPTVLLQQDLDLGAGHLAFFEGAMALGMLLGALGIARAGARARPARLLLVGMVLDGLTYLPFVVLPTYGLMLPAILLHGVFIPWIVVGRTSLLQAWVPDGMRGKVFALVGLTVSGMTALSAFAAGWVAEIVGARGLFLVAGVFASLAGVGGMVLVGRRLERVRVRASG